MADRKEVILIVITVSRLLLATGLVVSLTGDFLWTLLWMVLVLVADQFDGTLARHFDADGYRRRIADVIVDHLTVTSAFLAVFVVHPEYQSPGLILAWVYFALAKWSYSVPGIISLVWYRVLLRSKGSSNKIFNLGQAVVWLLMSHGASVPFIIVVVVALATFKLRISWASIDSLHSLVGENRSGDLLIVENHLPLLGRRTSRVVQV